MTRNTYLIGPVLLVMTVMLLVYKSSQIGSSFDRERWESSFHPHYMSRYHYNNHLQTYASGYVVIFFALPKCGSRTLLSIVLESRDYQGSHLTVDNNLTLLPVEMMADEEYAITFITEHLSYIRVPAFVYTHSRFVDIGSSFAKPLRYISVIRDPLDRLVSRYYYRRNRDETDMTEKERTWRESLSGIITNETFDECIRRNRSECTSDHAYISTISHFCGRDSRCNHNATWAIERAKYNVVNYFDVVGIMEDYASFVSVIEMMLPLTFRGARESYEDFQSEPSGGVASMKTQRKVPPSDEIRRVVAEKLHHDYEFYKFVKERFEEQKRMLGI